jgi:4-carboxymuconolactone decarboxylase
MNRRLPKPPKTYDKFIRQYPKLGKAWDRIAEAGEDGPIDQRTARLLKLAIAVGAMREGAVHASARKALAIGISKEEIYQVIALGAGTLGLPSTVAVYSWIEDLLEKKD